ncbi:23S rRNA (pseudouridine(1915)-N(3))-methyltransferase RlmH [Brevibacillus fortis]|uniref:23S rRNA (pseudouridine(1915)-N(3))-methyltransferase RlmH n=1 Tax=Brevibacillus fortis TaxID=2126352 RepID=UPI001304BBFD|nr:23S rRNA (pseudouridine(1915)-N(3))-methyltransferase RlmH [Brevibacillus fortis]
MQFTILSVGKINNESLSGVEEYSRRLAVYCRMNFVEIPEEDRQENINASEMEQLKIKEGRKILTQIKQDQHVIVLTGEGVPWTPRKLSVQIEHLSGTGQDEILFVIGGAFGLSEAVLERANERLSLPKKEYPHRVRYAAASV